MTAIPDTAPLWVSELPPSLTWRTGVLGSAVTTMAVGGPLEVFAEPRSLAELQELRQFATTQDLPLRILGAGSNLLVADNGVPGCTLRLGRTFAEVTDLGGSRVSVGGATSLMTLARRMSRAGLSGLEFAAGIPASLGGAVFMNAGAHGGEVCERIESITVLLGDGEVTVLPRAQLSPIYRSMRLPEGAIVVSATLQLVPGDAATSEALLAKLVAERRRTQPLQLPSAGSIFRNPDAGKGLYAGALIEACGLKGAHEGGAAFSALHANWIVNPERRATCADIEALMNRAREAVEARFGVGLEAEIQRWNVFADAVVR